MPKSASIHQSTRIILCCRRSLTVCTVLMIWWWWLILMMTNHLVHRQVWSGKGRRGRHSEWGQWVRPWSWRGLSSLSTSLSSSLIERMIVTIVICGHALALFTWSGPIPHLEYGAGQSPWLWLRCNKEKGTNEILFPFWESLWCFYNILKGLLFEHGFARHTPW